MRKRGIDRIIDEIDGVDEGKGISEGMESGWDRK